MKHLVLTIAVATLVLGCQKRSSDNSPGEKPLTPTQSHVDADRPATDFDKGGYERFKLENPEGKDVTEEFLQKYSGRFPEERAHIKVNGSLSIDASNRRIKMKIGTNQILKEVTDEMRQAGIADFCSIKIETQIERVVSVEFGYRISVKENSLSKKTRDCLLSRLEPFDVARENGMLDFELDYYNANTLRLSLRDAYIFFLRE